jgi:glycerol uptake facilitator-like aquaporin
MTKYIAEFIGTAILSLAVLGSVVLTTNIQGSLVAGITLAILAYAIGKISGAHINPAVTLGLFSLKKINKVDTLFYILAQFAGAALALIALRFFSISIPLRSIASAPAFFAELVGALVFTFGIASVVFNKKESEGNLFPFVIGASLTIGATIAAGLGSYGVLNPAVAFALGTFNLAYLLGPIVGSVFGMWLYAYLSCNCTDTCTDCECPIKDLNATIASRLKK